MPNLFLSVNSVDEDSGEVTMKAGTPKGRHTLKVSVSDRVLTQTITAVVNINVIYIYGDAVLSAGSMRLKGMCKYKYTLITI